MEKLDIHSFLSNDLSPHDLQQEIDALTHQMTALKGLLSDKSKHNDALQAKHLREQKRAETLMRLIKEKEARIARLEEFEILCRTLTQQKQGIEEHLEAERKRNHPLQHEKTELVKSLATVQRSLQLLEEEIASHRQELTNRDHAIAQLQHDLREERKAFQQTIDHLKEAVSQLEDLTKKHQSLQLEKDELAAEQQALLLQFDRLRAVSQEAQANEASARATLSERDQLIDQLYKDKNELEARTETEKRKLEDHLRQRNARIEILEQEVETFKSVLEHQQNATRVKEEAMLEIVQAAERDVETQKEQINSLNSRVRSLEAELTDANHQTAHVQEELSKVLADRQANLDMILQLQRETEERAQKHAEQLQQRNSKIDGLTQHVATLENERYRFEDTIARAKKTQEERDNELKAAQQHLAKKVKEAALASEQMEEAALQANRLQRDMKELRNQIDAYKNDVQQLQQHERRLEDQLIEQQRVADAKAAKWEKEYFRIHEQWQQSEAKIQHLRSVEEKHVQLHALLSDIGRFVEPQQPIPQKTVLPEPVSFEPTPLPLPLLPEMESEPLPPPLEEPKTDLFSAPKQQAPRIRQNLFD